MMDILDIDEALKDDSFMSAEERTHDDVCNILQQWRNNNSLPQCTPQFQQQVYTLNSRTFTRPKRKSTLNSDVQYINGPSSNISPQYPKQYQQNYGAAMLNLEIGGLVTTMHKSSLQDTSPPPSICSSIEGMNSSLVTSADFSNINFLQSTYNLDVSNTNNMNESLDNSHKDAYMFNDIMSARKALESLSMSNDGTEMKDLHLTQIDDMSFTLVKTASGCSTMANSIESVEDNNRTKEPAKEKNYLSEKEIDSKMAESGDDILGQTIVLNDEKLSNATFQIAEDNTAESESKDNQTFSVSAQSTGKEEKSIFNCEQSTPDAKCQTPDHNLLSSQRLESTPRTPQLVKRQYQFSAKVTDDVNISPIVPPNGLNSTYEVNKTFEKKQHLNSNILDGLPHSDAVETVEPFKNPNDIFGPSYENLGQGLAGRDMQNVMNMAKAEARLLEGNDDEAEYEIMLNEIGKVELSSQQLNLKRSLDSIRKRFTTGLGSEKRGRDAACKVRNVLEDNFTAKESETSASLHTETDPNPSRYTAMSNSEDFNEMCDPSTIARKRNTANSTKERLLSRRSRLYDDINLSTLPTQMGSFTVQKQEALVGGDGMNAVEENAYPQQYLQEKTEKATVTGPEMLPNTQGSDNLQNNYDIGKTAPTVNRTVLVNRVECESEFEMNVPSLVDVDDATTQVRPIPLPQSGNEQAKGQAAYRKSRREQTPTVFNNNKSETEEPGKTNPKYLTYKKPKAGKAIKEQNLPETVPHLRERSRLQQPRSLSRPRYINGLQKFSVSKTGSAGGLDNTATASAQLNSCAGSKEPQMGVKSKSYNNLLNSFGYAVSAQPKSSAKKSDTLAPADKQKSDGFIFKAPKIVAGIRHPGAAGAKHGGLVRPSSGYYSLAGISKGLPQANNGNSDADRQSPFDSMSSSSSRGSCQTAMNALKTSDSGFRTDINPSPMQTKKPTCTTGMSKPSGLKPPSNTKPSGLPRLANAAKR